MKRKGVEIFSLLELNTVITATMIASIVMLTVQSVQTVQRNNMKGLAEVDRHRFVNAITGISGEGTGSASLFLNNEYDTIEIDGGDATLSAADVDKTIDIDLPDQYQYSGSASGRQICIRKHGLQYTLHDGSCSAPICSNEDCYAHIRENDAGESVATWGYQCKNNALTDEEFFQHYYTTVPGDADGCDFQFSPSFVEINRLSCPDLLVDSDDETSGTQINSACSIVASWRCDGAAGDATLRIDIRNRQSDSTVRSSTRSMPCEGSVQHARFALMIPDVEGISIMENGYEAVGRVILPGNQSTETVRFGVRSRSNVAYPGVT